jgi:hypothetical protein
MFKELCNSVNKTAFGLTSKSISILPPHHLHFGFPFFLCSDFWGGREWGLGDWIQGLTPAGQALYYVSHSANPFCIGDF